MFGLIRKIKERRAQRKSLKGLGVLGRNFKTLDRLEDSGLLAWDAKNRRLLIAEPLALLMMKDAESWQTFIGQSCYLWLYNRECNAAWDAYMQREELAAVRHAMTDAAREHKTLSRMDVDRIKRSRRNEIAQSEVEPPRVKPFEFFIVRDTKEAQEQLVAVGTFDPQADTIEMATWEEVRLRLQTSKK